MNGEKSITYSSIEEWKAEGKRLFGDNPDSWQFRCPSCQRVQTPEEFEKQGIDPNDAPTHCLGRFFGGRKGKYKCDWAAFGLFSGPSYITHQNDRIAVFNFAVPATKEVQKNAGK